MGGGECPVIDGRRPQQQATLCWQSLWQESTQHPTSPPSKCTADAAMSGGGGGTPVTHGVGNGVGWVGCLHFWLHGNQFSYGLSVNSVLLQMCRSSAWHVTAAAAHLLARWLTNTAVAGKPKSKPKPRFFLQNRTETDRKRKIQNRNNTSFVTRFYIEKGKQSYHYTRLLHKTQVQNNKFLVPLTLVGVCAAWSRHWTRQAKRASACTKKCLLHWHHIPAAVACFLGISCMY